jgi:uncharacterized protein RhaS with RHS repeats
LAGGLNPYAYPENPVGWVDPLGLVFTACSTCTPAQQSQINSDLKNVENALKYNAKIHPKSTKAQSAYSDFMSLKNDPSYNVPINTTTGGNYYAPGSNTVMFNPTKNTGGTNKYGSNIRPTCIGLGHEIGHAIDDYKGTLSSGPASDPAKFPNTAEEYAVGFENQIRGGIWKDPKMQRPKY